MIKTPFEDWTHDQLVEFARKAQALVEELEPEKQSSSRSTEEKCGLHNETIWSAP